jgi:hypothetical protein
VAAPAARPPPGLFCARARARARIIILERQDLAFLGTPRGERPIGAVACLGAYYQVQLQRLVNHYMIDYAETFGMGEAMQHLVLSSFWEWVTDPFPMYRIKYSRVFVPVKDVHPVVNYRARAYDGARDVVLYEGPSRDEAERAKTVFDEEMKSAGRVWRAEVLQLFPILPAGKFRLAKTKKGGPLIIAGEDTSTRALVFLEVGSGFRGNVTPLKEHTTAQTLLEQWTGGRLGYRYHAVVLFAPGNRLAVHSWGRRTNQVVLYEWDGLNLVTKEYLKEEWDHLHSSEAVEIL